MLEGVAMTEPTPATVRAFVEHMLAEYGGKLTPKADAWEMRAAGSLLGALGILTAKSFADDYTTTIGSTVYAPFHPGDEGTGWTRWSQIEVIAHECQHLHQKRERGLRHEADYLTSSARRAHIEAEAYAVNAALHHWHHGVIESWWPGWRAESLRSYGCSAQDVEVATAHLRMIAGSVRRGVVVSHAARTAIMWLDEHAPYLRHPAVASRRPS